jgi:hypothetical protein
MAAAIIAIRKNQSEILAAEEDTSEESLLDNLRSSVPSKENRDAELFLNVSVLG